MSFTEVGSPGNTAQTDSQGQLQNGADKTGSDAAANVDYPTVVAPPGAAGIGHA